jgi:CRISPR-associated protein Cas2
METLVVYDISEDDKRRKLRSYLQQYGLRRVQYSGFVGDIDSHDRFVLIKEIRRYVSCERDSIYVVPLCNRCLRLCRIVAEKELSFGEGGEVKIVS